jgi:glycerol-3-phosphate acyltransferase PlsX
LSGYIFDLFRGEFRSSLRGRLAYLLLKPGIARIRHVFDYERAGGSPLLGVRGTVIITHGRARRRMVAFGVGVAATMARTRVPELIAEAIARQSPTAPAPTPATPAVEEPDALTAPGLESAS